MEYDLIVIGSGSVGSAAGYYASQAGLRVLMIDSAMPPHQAGSHHGQTRIIRHAYGEGQQYVPLVLRAQALWHDLENLSHTKLFHPCGVVNLSPGESRFIHSVRQNAAAFNLPIEILDAQQVRDKWPVFTVPDDYIGIYEPQAGFLRSDQAVASYIRLAREAGAGQLFNCPVSAINARDNGAEIMTAEGSYRGRKVVVTAGTWVKKLLPDLPITPVRKVFSWHQADGRYSENNRFPAFSVELTNGDRYYGFPSENNELKLGKHQGGQHINAPEQRLPFGSHAEDGSEVFGFLRQFLPGVGVCLHGASCSYDRSVDDDFIIDRLAENPQIMVITGLSGHGFKFASVLGEITALFAQDRPLPWDLAPFSLSRFS